MAKNTVQLLSLVALSFLWPLQAGEPKTFYLPLFEPSDSSIQASARSENGADVEKSVLSGRGWLRYEADGEVRLTLENGDSILANQPASSFSYPWIRLMDGLESTLKLLNPSGRANVVRIIGQRTDGTLASMESEMGALGHADVRLPEGLAFLKVEGQEPLVAYLIWKENGRTAWIDRGESTPPGKPEDRYAVVLEGRAAALELEVAGERLSIERSPDLADPISMTWRATDLSLKAAWVASDLEAFGEEVVGILRVTPGTAPELAGVLASDQEGNQVEVNVRLERLP